MQWELKSIGIWSVVKVGFFLHMILGFISGLLYAPFIMLSLTLGLSPELQALGLGADSSALGILLIVMPIAFAVGGAIFGTLFGLVAALVYNLIARVVGGLEVSLATLGEARPIAPVAAAAPPPPPHYQPPSAESHAFDRPTERPLSPPPPPEQQPQPRDDDDTLPPRSNQ